MNNNLQKEFDDMIEEMFGVKLMNYEEVDEMYERALGSLIEDSKERLHDIDEEISAIEKKQEESNLNEKERWDDYLESWNLERSLKNLYKEKETIEKNVAKLHEDYIAKFHRPYEKTKKKHCTIYGKKIDEISDNDFINLDHSLAFENVVNDLVSIEEKKRYFERLKKNTNKKEHLELIDVLSSEFSNYWDPEATNLIEKLSDLDLQKKMEDTKASMHYYKTFKWEIYARKLSLYLQDMYKQVDETFEELHLHFPPFEE